MAKLRTSDLYIDLDDIDLGLYALKDTTKAPMGSAREMKNMQVTDRGGIGPRPGIRLLGEPSDGGPAGGLYEFETAFGDNRFLIRAHDDVLEVLKDGDDFWSVLETGLTPNKEFDFATALVNENNQDVLVGSNRYDPFFSWGGGHAKVTGTDGSSIVVESTLSPEVLGAKDASDTSNASTTSINANGAGWASDQFKGMYIHFTSGDESGQVRKISGNDSNTINFASLSNSPGQASFEIKQLRFPENGRLMINGNSYSYSNIRSADRIDVGSSNVSVDDNTYALERIKKYPENPRGSRMTNFKSRIIVGRVRSALARNEGGTKQGYSAGSSVFVSEQKKPTSFEFDSDRKAGQGDLIGVPHGGGDITDVVQQEDSFYVFKSGYIEAIQYSQDGNDTTLREPLKSGVGSKGRVIQGSDDVYFVTVDDRLTSLGRVASKDIRPSTMNIGRPIKRILDKYGFGQGLGIEHKNRLYVPAKTDPENDYNDTVLVYNQEKQTFEGNWTLSGGYFESLGGRLVFSESDSANVYEALVGSSDERGDDEFPINSRYSTHFMNLTPSNAAEQAINSLYFEGYIGSGTEIEFQCFKDLNDEPFFIFPFDGELDGDSPSVASLGGKPTSLSPKGTVRRVSEDGRKHFLFRVYFPYQYGTSFSVGFSSGQTNADYEVTRFGMGLAETVTVDADQVSTS